MFRDQRLELTNQLGTCTERELRVDQILEGGGAQLFQVGDLKGGERLEGEIVERWPSPERERLPKLLDALFPRSGAALSNPSLEPAEVDLVMGDLEDVAAMPREQNI